MAEPLADQVIEKIGQAAFLYHRLVLLVTPPGGGKTSALQVVRDRMQAPLINVNLELSRLLLDLTERNRVLQLPGLLSNILDSFPGDVALLDNVELLFDVSLKQDPLRLFQGLSRNRILVVAFSGSIEGNHIAYAAPDHPEYKRYAIKDFLVVGTETFL